MRKPLFFTLIGLCWLVWPVAVLAQPSETQVEGEVSADVPPAGHDQGMPAATDEDVKITLTVDPPDATVFLEGARFEGSRSERVFFLKPGWYRFRVTKPGYPDREFMVDLKRKQPRTIEVRLTQRTEILVQIDNPDAVAVLDDETTLPTGLALAVEPGKHDLKIYVRDFMALREEIEIEKGVRLVRKYSLRLLAPIELIAYPPDTSIVVDGREVGRGIWSGEVTDNRHHVRFEHDDLPPKVFSINPERGHKLTVTQSLTRNKPEDMSIWFSMLLLALPDPKYQHFEFPSRNYDLITIGHLLAIGGRNWGKGRWGGVWEAGIVGLSKEAKADEIWYNWLHLGAGPLFRLEPGGMFGIQQMNQFDLMGDESGTQDTQGTGSTEVSTNQSRSALSWIFTHRISGEFRFRNLRLWPAYQFQWGRIASIDRGGKRTDPLAVHGFGGGIDYWLPGLTVGAEAFGSPIQTKMGNRHMGFVHVQVFLRATSRIYLEDSQGYRRDLKRDRGMDAEEEEGSDFRFPDPVHANFDEEEQ